MTYFLEKTFSVLFDDKKQKLQMTADLRYAIIRPCELEYKQVLDYFAGRRYGMLTLQGCIEQYDDRFDGSVEEWLINLATEKGLTPDFEQHMIYYDFNSYIAKTINLRTGKTIEDVTDRILKKLNGEIDIDYGCHKRL